MAGDIGVSTRINKLHAHNIWLSFLALYGTAGLAAYLWLRAYVYRCLALLYRQKLSLFPLLAAVQGLIVVHGIVDFIMMSPQGGVLVLAAAAVAAGLARSLEPELQRLNKLCICERILPVNGESYFSEGVHRK